MNKIMRNIASQTNVRIGNGGMSKPIPEASTKFQKPDKTKTPTGVEYRNAYMDRVDFKSKSAIELERRKLIQQEFWGVKDDKLNEILDTIGDKLSYQISSANLSWWKNEVIEILKKAKIERKNLDPREEEFFRKLGLTKSSLFRIFDKKLDVKKVEDVVKEELAMNFLDDMTKFIDKKFLDKGYKRNKLIINSSLLSKDEVKKKTLELAKKLASISPRNLDSNMHKNRLARILLYERNVDVNSVVAVLKKPEALKLDISIPSDKFPKGKYAAGSRWYARLHTGDNSSSNMNWQGLYINKFTKDIEQVRIPSGIDTTSRRLTIKNSDGTTTIKDISHFFKDGKPVWANYATQNTGKHTFRPQKGYEQYDIPIKYGIKDVGADEKLAGLVEIKPDRDCAERLLGIVREDGTLDILFYSENGIHEGKDFVLRPIDNTRAMK